MKTDTKNLAFNQFRRNDYNGRYRWESWSTYTAGTFKVYGDGLVEFHLPLTGFTKVSSISLTVSFTSGFDVDSDGTVDCCIFSENDHTADPTKYVVQALASKNSGISAGGRTFDASFSFSSLAIQTEEIFIGFIPHLSKGGELIDYSGISILSSTVSVTGTVAESGRINPIAPRSTSKNLNEQIAFSWSYSGDGTLSNTELQWSTDNATWSSLATVNNGDTTWTAPAYKFSIGTVYWRARATNSYGLTGDWCSSASFTGTYPTLSVSLTPSELYVGSTITADFTNRLSQQLTVRAYYNTTLLYETTTSRDSLTITCPETWFSTAGVTSNSMSVKIRASDNLGRTSADATFTLRIPVLTMTLNKTSVVIGDTITATFGERIGRTVALSFKTTKNNSNITLFSDNVTQDSITITCPKTWFTSHSELDNDNTITVQVTASAGSNQVIKSFEFKYTTLSVDVSETSITVGQSFTIDVTNRELEQLTVTMTANSRTVATTTATSDQKTISTDISYYNNAQDSKSTSLNVTVTVSDQRGRTASDTFSLSAYSSSMLPHISSVQSSIVQPQNVSSEYPNTYIANISKVKVSVRVTFPTLAGASRAVVNYSGTSMNLMYNGSTGYYEATTTNPITEDTTFQVFITDERGFKSSSSTSVTDVVAYSAPTVNIINYHRCDADHTANDSGAYCEMTVEYTISSIDNTNVGTASVTSSIYTDSQTLQTYTQQIVYFFAADIEHSYDIVVSLADKIMSDSRTVRLSTAGVIMDFLSGGKGIGLGKVAETQRMVEVNPEWRFRSANIDVKVENNMVDLGALLAQIQQRLTNGGL